MNLDKTTNALKRINRLYELITEMGEASSTEQDLLKVYVKDLYKAVSDGEELVAESTPTPAVVNSVPAPAPVTVAPTPEPEPAPEPDPTVQEVDTPPPPQKAAPIAANPEIAELFETEKISELSDKLSFSPVSDLTKAMGLNEKIFTVNELFGGNNEEFQNMMVALNGLDSYDEAKSVLMSSVAVKYDWSKPDKTKKAKNFIKLVQRRYN